MPPKRIEVQPIISSSTSASHSSADRLNEDSSDAPVRKKQRETRATHSDRLRRQIEERGPLPVTFRKYDGRPTGEYASAFMTELGVAVRSFAPLQVQNWKHLTEEQKRPMFDRLQSDFVVDFGTGPYSVKKETEQLMNHCYRDNRQRMHKHYKTLIDLPWEERLKHMPEAYCDSESDWEFMCKLFDSERFQNRSAKNTINRAKMQFNHRGGSKSFVQYSYDFGGGSSRSDRITLFNRTHYSSKKGWIGDAETAYKDMVQRREEYRQTQMDLDSPSDGSQPIDELEIADRVCDEVLGRRSGYIRGLGNGPKPSKLISSDANSRRATNAELRQELASTQGELESTRASLQSAEEKIHHLQETVQTNQRIMEANQRMMMQVFEKIAPDVLQSLTQHSSFSAPPAPPP